MPAEEKFEGVVDLIRMKAIYWDDDNMGTTYEARAIPENMQASICVRKVTPSST